MIKNIKTWFKSLFEVESEFTKKWMAKFTKVVFVMLIFYLFFSQELLLLHFKAGLSRQMCKVFFECYTSVTKTLVTGYAVTFISSMGKAFLAKQQAEKNKLMRDLNGNGIDDAEEGYIPPQDVDEKDDEDSYVNSMVEENDDYDDEEYIGEEDYTEADDSDEI